MAPERLIVFELTGDVSNFAKAAAHVPGLEFIGAEEAEADEDDKNPVLYLLIPDVTALRQMLSLWRDWQAGKNLPRGFAPWKGLFSQLRDLRAWGPKDRVTLEDLAVLAAEHADANGNVRLELELVYRAQGDAVEAAAVTALQGAGGNIISRTRIAGAGYHALLVEVPEAELMRVRERGDQGLVAEESILHIRPQCVAQVNIFEVKEGAPMQAKALPAGNPIAAIFDAVPLAGHPQLAGRLVIDDIFNLEPLSVGSRVHGTAMASAVIHGDLNGPQQSALDRPVYFVNVMYAPGVLDQPEQFPNRLPADLFHEALIRLKLEPNATAPGVIIVNVSLGDRNKPFAGRMSGWARVIDYLSHHFGVLFVVSAGNHFIDYETAGIDTTEFEGYEALEQARVALRASGNTIANRRVLAPAEAINALTVGALHSDHHPPAAQLPASTFDVWANTGLCNVSSALGPGYGGATKPEILAPGGRHHVRLGPAGVGHRLSPLNLTAASFGGIRVAVPPGPTDVDPNQSGRTIGTSVAAALTTSLAIRAHEALETVYNDFLQIPAPQRALLLKALLVHCARWTDARDLIIEVLGPADANQHVRQKDNVRRYLGYGAIEAGMVIDCALDRATLWGVGSLTREQAHKFQVPLPAVISGKAQLHELATTVSWFAPPTIGKAQYRGVRLKLVEPDELAMFGVAASKHQPDTNQAHRGTIIHRRWTGAKAAALAANATIELIVQREPDESDELVPYAMVTTVAMPGVNEIYTQVRARVAIKPQVFVPT